MKVIKGNIWDYLKTNKDFMLVPTNGYVKNNGECVMGAGLAKQVKEKYPEIPKLLGDSIKKWGGNVPHYLSNNIVSFPVKDNWWNFASLELIERSAQDMVNLFNFGINQERSKKEVKIYLPKVGCGNGRLFWKDVEPILDKYLDERFIVVDLK